MSTVSPVYPELNKAWKSTCRILFGKEVGDLKEYEEWLKEYLPPIGKRVSHSSGKEVNLCVDHYCKTANFVSADEVKETAVEPLTINEVKDMDSLVEAISEKWEYCGNKILGKSSFVENSDDITDAQYVSDSAVIKTSSHIFATYSLRDSHYIFGSSILGASNFMLKCLTGRENVRCFDSHFCVRNSDLYFCHNCTGCNDMIFSFNQVNKSHCIGNLQLPQEEFRDIKVKLLTEISDELKKSKRFSSIFELVPKKQTSGTKISISKKNEKLDMGAIEKDFSSTFKVLFKQDTKDISSYEKWLSKLVISTKDIISPFGSQLCIPTRGAMLYQWIPEKRIVSMEEMFELGKSHLDRKDVGNLQAIIGNLGEISYFNIDGIFGSSRNIIKSGGVSDGSNLYKSYNTTGQEDSGVSFVCGHSKFVFGSSDVYESQFCMKCHNSIRLSRCFELDSSADCADSYFAHNCEGLSDTMFCFNTKAKRYAIGNAQLAPGKYRGIKDSLVEQMADELMKKKELKYDIYNIGCGKI